MNNKSKIIIEIIIVISLFVWYTFSILIPELKQEYGSSDKFINSNSFNSMIELNIDNKIDIAIITNKENELYHLFFFNKESTILYNENIENNKLSKGIKKIINILLEKNELKDNSNILITSYNKDKLLKDTLLEELNNLDLEFSIIEEEKTIKELIEELNISGDNEDKMLLELDYYSKNITGIGHKKNKK